MTTASIRFNNDTERKNYESGLAIVKAKLAGNRRMTPEGRHQYSMAVGLTTVAVVKKLSALVKAGIPPVPARPASTSTRTAPATKHYAPPAPKRALVYHCYTTRGIFA